MFLEHKKSMMNDNEDWRNDAENSALPTGINYILKYIQLF